MEPCLVVVPNSLSQYDKTLQLSTSDNAIVELYIGNHHKQYVSELKPSLKLDVTSSSIASATSFEIQPLAPQYGKFCIPACISKIMEQWVLWGFGKQTPVFWYPYRELSVIYVNWNNIQKNKWANNCWFLVDVQNW